MEAFYALPKRTERIIVSCILKSRDSQNFPASLSLSVAKGTQLLRYFQSSPWLWGWPALRTAPHCHGHFRGASLWVVLLDLLLQLHSSLYKPSLCETRHRVQICFLQRKTPGTASLLEYGSNSKMSGAFWTHFPKSLLFTREYQWFILVNDGQALQPKYLLGVGEGGRQEITGGEKHGRKPPTPSRHPQCFTPSSSLLYWMVYKSCSWLEFSLLTVLYTYKYI